VNKRGRSDLLPVRSFGCRQGVGLYIKPVDPQIASRQGIQPEILMGGERVVDRLIATGDDHGEASLRGGRKRFPVWQADNQRLAAEDLFGHRGYPLDHPSLAEKIVSDEDAVRLEEVFDIDQRLLGKQVALEPDIGVSAVENQRVDERVLDKVVFVLG